MGNAPSEYYGAKCYKCGKSLPPCVSFDNYHKATINGRHVYVFNGGQYYREVGCDDAHECCDCFEKLKREQQRLEQRKKEEERQRREMKRQQEEERLRREVLRQQEEETRRREEERQQETVRLRREKKKRQEEERLRREGERQQEEERQRREEERRLAEVRLRKERKRRQEEEKLRREVEKRQEEERLRKEEERQQEQRLRREKKRLQEEERLRREEERRQEEERLRREEEKRQEQRLRREKKRLQEEERLRREEERRQEEERLRREEERRQEKKRLRREVLRRQEEERLRIEALRRQEEERLRREEERRQEEERLRIEALRRQEEERLRREKKRQQEERLRREEERRQEVERQRREEERRQEEERQWREVLRQQEEERLREKKRRQEEERLRREMERQQEEEEKLRREVLRQKEEERLRREEERRQEEERLRREVLRRQEERLRIEEERRQKQEKLRREKEKRQEEERQRREEERRQEEERLRREKERLQEEERWRGEMLRQLEEEERLRREMERQQEEEEKLRREVLRQQEEERLRIEEERRQKQEKLRREKEKRQEEERQRREEERRQEEERLRREKERLQEEERSRKEEERLQEEERWRREMLRQLEEEERLRREKERLQEEERSRREEERRQQEERWRRDEERRQEEERLRREVLRRQEEERLRREEERRQEEERQKTMELNGEIKKTLQSVKEKVSMRDKTDKREVVKMFYNHFQTSPENNASTLMEILSSRCNILSEFVLSQLSSVQLKKVISVLQDLLFDEWVNRLPSFETLKHAQVLLTELCILFRPESGGIFLVSASDHIHFLVEEICQSECDMHQCFLLTQALFLTFIDIFVDAQDMELNALYIAEKWSGVNFPTVEIFTVRFLETLLISLQKVVESALKITILDVEKKCFKFLLSRLENLNKEATGSIKILLKLVDVTQWTPTEAIGLFKILTEKYDNETDIYNILQLVQLNHILPSWKDESGQSLFDLRYLVDSESFYRTLQNTMKSQNEHKIDEILSDMQSSRIIENADIIKIKQIVLSILKCLDVQAENKTREHTLPNPLKRKKLKIKDLELALHYLCKAVFYTKRWWPSVSQMIQWCLLILHEDSETLEIVGFDEDPCVTAMFLVMQVLMGSKVDVVLSSTIECNQQMHEWSDFYKHFGISSRSIKEDNDSAFVSDIVFSTMDEYIAHYLQYFSGLQIDQHKRLTRGFVVDKKCLVLNNSFFSKSSDNVVLKYIQRCQTNLMKRLFSQEKHTEQSGVFIRALFQTLHTTVENMPDANGQILAIFQNLTKHEFTSEEETTLKFLNAMTKRILARDDINFLPNGEEACSDFLLTTAMQLCGEKTVTELIQNLLAGQLWTSVQVLKLLETLLESHFRDGNLSIMKLINLLTIYQISPEWKNKNDQTILQILCSIQTMTDIKDLEKQFKNEGSKSIDDIFKEIREFKEIDEATINTAYSVVKHVQELILSGVKMKFAMRRIHELSISREVKDLQEVLSALCYVVHSKMGWWPRLNQLISWCVFALSESGTLLEIGTGEGKSCVIAMYAALRVLRGEKVDIVSSSSVLCQRDSKEWSQFYKELGITVGTNTGNEDQNECYQNDIIYGTVDAFAADYLRQIFEMKDTRLNREFQCVIIDEVDSLLLDNGVQLTYLSDDIAGIQHLNTVLSLIWGHVSQYGLMPTESETAVRGPVVPFHKAVYDAIDTEDSEINGPLDILQIAEDNNIVPQGFVKELSESEHNQYLDKLGTINKDSMISFFVDIVKDYLPYNIVVYKQNENGFLQLINPRQTSSEDIQELSFLVLDKGLCCALYSSEEILHNPITAMIQEKLKFTPCEKKEDDKISIPGFLKNLVDNKLITWIQNAFLALKLKQGREYIVDKERICPVDFKSTGIVELNKKWGDGLQQFLEMKHRIKLSSLTVVTNYISNITCFRMYQGKIYGTTGTLGNQDEIQLLQDLYPKLSASRMPSFTREKLFETEGIVTSSHEEWKAEICNVVKDQVTPSNGRAALVICETINKAKELHEELQGQISGEIILYSRSDKDCKIGKILEPGDVIVATNLAGRGTDIKVSDEVNNNGGLFVILSFLAENLRIERQAFGRTARKGNPGSAKIVMCTDHLEGSLKQVSFLHDAKLKRNILSKEKVEYMMTDLQEVYLQENLFFEYCKILKYIHENANDQDRMTVVGIMNEYWGIWLQTKAKEIEQLKTDKLLKSLTEDMEKAKDECLKEESPISSIYHYVKLGNNELMDKRWEEGLVLYERAMHLDPSWAAIAFYNHACCTLLKGSADCIATAINDLNQALESMKNFHEACAACQYLLKLSQPLVEDGASESLNKQFIIKINVFNFFQKNIEEAIEKLTEIRNNKGKAEAIQRPIFQLVSHCPDDLTEELCLLKSQGLYSVFSVQEKPHFSWGGLAVFFIGLAQVVAGVFLTALTYGVLATVGTQLITDGISNFKYAAEVMKTGVFSWKDWAIEKAISVAVSLIGFGVGKLLAKGFRACKRAVTGVGKELKALGRSVNQMSHTVVERNIFNSAKFVVKTAAEQTGLTFLSKLEDFILQKIMNSIEEKIKEELTRKIEEDIMNGTLSSPTDVIILSHFKESRQIRNLEKEDYIKNNMMSVFTECSKHVLFSTNLTWQKNLIRSVIDVINKAKDQLPKSKMKSFFTIVQVTFMASLFEYCCVAAGKLLNEFSSKYNEELKTLIGKKKLEKKIDCEDCDLQYLHAFKKELAGVISVELKDVLMETIKDTFLGHVQYIAQQKINGQLMKPIRKILRSNETLELVKAGQKHNFIVNRPLSEAGEISHHDVMHLQSYAEKVKKSETPGTIFSLRNYAEQTGTRVIVLTEGTHGKLNKMLVLNPSSKPASRTIELIYKPKSEQFPNGHYNAWIDNREVIVENKDNSCMYYAVARSMNPGGSVEEISSRAKELRLSEAKNLIQHPNQWVPFLKCKERLERISGGHSYLAEGEVRIEETSKLLQEETGKVGKCTDLRIQNRGMGHFINADHQPPLICIVDAARNNQNSKLANAFLEVGLNQSELTVQSVLNTTANQTSTTKQAWLRNHTHGLVCVNVPKRVHDEFPSTRSPKCRSLTTKAIENDQVIDAFKYTILGTIPRFKYNSTRGFNESFGEPGQVYGQSFQKHSIKLVKEWFSELKKTSPGSLITDNNHQATLIRWIETKQYENENDPHWKNVAGCF
ncbi:uncharacterized protein LOC125709921 [Brienomyrus brachyistius]|uniref:uncharacterized protein LOC125709921 n=1 Tax=Brienomyrus brachyistius TaxID=42636 RepID=UPI0020B373E2|nr:uncharacterized protein LOC125709921 [Brienomyrus brachyistius]XP_048834894.1 uncharacterized protein LOC125709921 [Brienomyrus brachyistius]